MRTHESICRWLILNKIEYGVNTVSCSKTEKSKTNLAILQMSTDGLQLWNSLLKPFSGI